MLEVVQLLVTDPDPAAGLAGGAVVTGQINVRRFQRVRGTFRQDVAGTLVLEWRNRWDADPVYSYTVPQDSDQTDFTYGFDVISQGKYLTWVFTNGGAPSTFFRAEVAALTD